MHDLCTELYPICRSITGDGVRRTLEVLRRELPIEVHEVPSGTQAFDWTVPPEWNVRDAYILDAARPNRVIDFQRSNLHVVGYSVPVNERRSARRAPNEHLFTLPDHPEWIPYRTVVLRPAMGLLPRARRPRPLHRRRLRRRDRRVARARFVDLRRVLASGSRRRRGAPLVPRVPPLARERQPLGHRAGRVRRCCLPRRAAPLLVPASVHAGHHRLDRLARAQRAAPRAHPTRSRAHRSRRPGALHLQEEPAGRRRHRSSRRARASAWLARRPRRRLQPVRLRRAAILLARLRSPRRAAGPNAARRVPGVPHLCRRPLVRRATTARRGTARHPRADRDARRQSALREHQPEVRAATRPARSVPRDRRQPRSGVGRDGAAVGAQPVGRRVTTCSRSPTTRGCRSVRSGARPMRSSSTICWIRCRSRSLAL